MISVIIPTYNATKCLDLCIESILKGQKYDNEIIVVVDGTHEINKPILEKYKNKIKSIIFEENYGLCKATNYGVYNCSNNKILVVNDDNVFPKGWDELLLEDFTDDCVLTPNQIEPKPSMFKQFVIYDFGDINTTFSVDKFQKEEPKFRKNVVSNEGSTLPFLISKKLYLMLGGWDESYPSGNVVDWEFFLKANLAKLKLKRTYKCNFYHFVSVTHKSPEKIKESQLKEAESFEYFKYKWGSYPIHDPNTNVKSI